MVWSEASMGWLRVCPTRFEDSLIPWRSLSWSMRRQTSQRKSDRLRAPKLTHLGQVTFSALGQDRRKRTGISIVLHCKCDFFQTPFPVLCLLLLLLSHFSRVGLCATPETAAHQAPRPWDSPGKNTGVGCHFLLQCMVVKVKSLKALRTGIQLSPGK